MYKVAYWTMAHLVYDDALLQAIREEVAPAYKNGALDEAYLAENCPRLDSLLSEILRLTVGTALVRDVISPTRLGGYLLKEGSKILVRPLDIC